MLHKSMLIVSAALVVASCNRQDSTICETPPPASQDGESACLHRAAYQFRFSPGTNTELAKAVVEQCSSEIVANHEEMASRLHLISTADQNTTYELDLQNAESDALRRIIQAKAGNCDKPT